MSGKGSLRTKGCPSPSFCRDPHPMQSTGHCRVRVSVSWTDPNLILDEGPSVLAIFGIWGALWQESFLPSCVSSSIAGARRGSQRRGLAPTWVGAQPWLFCSSGFSGLLSGWAGPAKCWLFSLPTRSCHRALPWGCGHRDSNSSHSHTGFESLSSSPDIYTPHEMKEPYPPHHPEHKGSRVVFFLFIFAFKFKTKNPCCTFITKVVHIYHKNIQTVQTSRMEK